MELRDCGRRLEQGNVGLFGFMLRSLAQELFMWKEGM